MTVEWISGAMRRVFAMLTLCAFIVAPMIIAATHGPGLPSDSVQAAEPLQHGHSHPEPEPGQTGVGHDATDHEHPTQVVLTQGSDAISEFSALHIGISDVSAGTLVSSGLRRPPRDSIV
ncbi:hypothetical protein [Cypionkella sp.]|uniref:hypothetical protein n=1 Tax=Cypionkella sp. TaxID=2811411 RepID=UPI00271A058C|nr:hypothetical protein [Cypionkella sp.]MDO8984427.1 hypothetical protein [Cypionkella sp.]MDP2048094.1 hypothetical protein [Cypionkella sp.]